MKILTELSGFGHYGVCSIISADQLDRMLTNFPKHLEGWELSQPDRITGIDASLWRLTDLDENEDTCRYAWRPDKLHAAMRSIGILDRLSPGFEDFNVNLKAGKEDEQTFLASNSLNFSISRNENGWHVRGSFGYQIWDVIESDYFSSDLLPRVVRELELYWEDQNGRSQRMPNTFVHDGAEGKTLQIYHPVGNGCWISGARKKRGDHQLCDHNTDYEAQAFGHIFGLCLVQKYCREHLAGQ